ncbi:MAG: ATP-binding protein [Actinomycetota bacterium]
MLNGSLAVPIHFTVELLAFLVAAGGALLVLSRPNLIPGAVFNRICVALGFGCLAASAVVHGGGFVATDAGGHAAQILLALRAVGYGFAFVGVAASAGATIPAAGVAFSVREPIVLLPAGSAIALAVSCFAVSAKSGRRDLSRFGLAAIVIAASEVLNGVTPNARFGSTAGAYAFAAHALLALGYLILGSWLWTGVRSSIRTRFVASFVSLLVLVVLTLSTALTGVISNNVQSSELKTVKTQLVSAIETMETTDARNLVRTTQSVTSQPAVPGYFQTGSKGFLHDKAKELASRSSSFFDFDFVVFMDAHGRLLAYSGHGPFVESKKGPVSTPLKSTDVLKIIGSDVVSDVVNGRPIAANPQRISATSMAVTAAAEVLSTQAPHPRIGILATGRYIDALTAEDISANIGSTKASLLIDRSVVATELPSGVTSKAILGGIPRTEFATQKAITQQSDIGGHSYFTAAGNIKSSSGEPVGTLVLASPASIVAKTREGVTQILFIVAMGVGAVVLVLAYFSGRRITRPIQVLTDTARAVREGDLSAHADVSGEDEVGQLGATFNEMTSALARMTGDLRQAAREEHELRARIETIIQSMADALVAIDDNKNILAFNREAEIVIGMPSADAIGRPVTDVINAVGAQGESVRLPIFDLSEGSVGGIFIEQGGGEKVPVAITSAVLYDDVGEIAGGVAVLRDMTREREIERMKTEFLSNISHELRTPLTPIKGYAEILNRKEIPPEKTRQFAKGIMESTQRLERIVELLVDFSAMEAGRMSPRTTPVDIGALVESLANQVRGRAPKHEVVTEVDEKLPQVIGDERLLKRSLEEVLDNAVKFSPRGGRITVEAHAASGNCKARSRPKAVEVSIADQGIGIPPEDLPKIFSDFQQLDGSETRAYGGLGLGLAFVQRIVDVHEGTVKVDSTVDEGTRLTISIPAASGAGARK